MRPSKISTPAPSKEKAAHLPMAYTQGISVSWLTKHKVQLEHLRKNAIFQKVFSL